MSIEGILSTYPRPNDDPLPYFVSGDMSSVKAGLFIGGLYNGIMDPWFLPDLSGALKSAGWKLVQLHWSSSYAGFGRGSIARDADEMEALVKHLVSTGGITKVVLMGTSTGCQDVMQYLSTRSTPQVVGGILQAPISDREEMERDTWAPQVEIMKLLPQAKRLVEEGKGETVMPMRLWNRVEISAYRLFSLAGVGGDDDFFAHDIPDHADGVYAHPLDESFGRLSAPVLALYSEKDEHVFPPAPGETWDQVGLMNRWKKFAKCGLEWRIIKGASHTCKSPEAIKEMLGEVVSWINKL